MVHSCLLAAPALSLGVGPDRMTREREPRAELSDSAKEEAEWPEVALSE